MTISRFKTTLPVLLAAAALLIAATSLFAIGAQAQNEESAVSGASTSTTVPEIGFAESVLSRTANEGASYARGFVLVEFNTDAALGNDVEVTIVRSGTADEADLAFNPWAGPGRAIQTVSGSNLVWSGLTSAGWCVL